MSVTQQQVAELYVATFNRAPDASGLDYWVNDSFGGDPTIELIAESFFDQPETQALYPTGTTDTEFVTSIYENLFNRAQDAEGLAYWIGENGLGGSMTRSVMIEAMKNGAQGDDAEIIANKAEVALYYVNNDQEGTEFSLEDVTASDDTVTTAKSAVDALIPVPGETFTLTTGADEFTGAAGDDIFDGVTSSLSAARTLDSTDVLDGGDGADTLNVELNTAFTGFSTGSVANIETVNLTNASSIARNFDATGITGVDKYTVDASTAAVNLVDLEANVNVDLSNQASGSFSAALASGADAVTGTADAMTLGLTDIGTAADADATPAVSEASVTITTDSIEELTVEATGVNVVDFDGDAIKNVVVTGEGSFDVTAMTSTVKTFRYTY